MELLEVLEKQKGIFNQFLDIRINTQTRIDFVTIKFINSKEGRELLEDIALLKSITDSLNEAIIDMQDYIEKQREENA
jgi:hypothetical protein